MEEDEEQLSGMLHNSHLVQRQQQREYEWLYRQLEYTNRAIAPTLTAFRYRAIKDEYLE
jgi:hypothetical protein